MPYADPAKNAECRKRYAQSERGKQKARESARAPHRRAKKKAWAEANRDRLLLSQRRTAAKKKAMVVEARSRGCVDCGENDLRVIQLHAPDGHLTPKGCIGDGSRFTYEELRAELQIVVPLCANCHLKRHA